MNSKLIPFLALLALAFATGCHRRSTGSQIVADQSQAAKVYNEAELDKLITPGMSITDITNKFGLPGSAVKVTENKILLTYMFPFETRQEEGPYMTGFGIDIKDGRVVSWSPVTGMTGKTIQGGEPQSPFGEQSFQIFLATDSLTNLVNTFDSQGSSDAMGLNATPDLIFKAKVFAGKSGNEHPGEQSVILVVGEQDASKLQDLSQKNFGKRLLIICHNKAIAAPMISAPLASRQLMFTVKDSHVLDSLRSR